MSHTSLKDPAQAFEQYGEEARRDWVAELKRWAKDGWRESCLDAALEYATKRDWFVFPADIEDGEKKSHKSGKYSKDGRNWGATKDLKQITRNFKRWPDAIGIPTGIDNDIVIIETDTVKGHARLKGKGKDGLASLRELEAKYGPLPDTLMAESPSDSIHRYYRHPGMDFKIGRDGFAVGLDVKGDGGMVIAPPSVRADGVYRWINGLPIAELPIAWRDALVTAAPPNAKHASHSDEPINYFEQHGNKPIPAPPLEMMRAALNAIPNLMDVKDRDRDVDRKKWVDVGHAVKREYPGEEGWKLFRDWSATWTGWATPEDFDEAYTRKKWDGFKPHSISAGSLFRLADAATPGWRDAYEASSSKVETDEAHASEAFGYSWTWHWHGEAAITDSRPFLIQDVFPEVGTGVLAGQWGTLKTFLTLDIAASVMSGTDFIEFPVRRQGGVLFIACEGESEVPVRLEAVLREKCPGMDKAPFAWVEGSPRLLDPNAAKILVAMIKSASERMMQEFGVPPVLVIVDTTSKAAGYTRGGEDNDSAIAKIIERTFRAAAKACGLFILGVDHFGKDASVGTKGSSGKEDDVDVILAALGDKDITGQVSDTRLCLRKRRSGANGQEFAYNMRVVDMGIDQYGSPMSTLVLDWETKPVGSDKLPRPPKDLWQKKAALRLLRKSLMAIATDQGRDFFPADDKPPVQAVDERLVRQEFYTRFLAEGTPEQKADTRRKAFKRAVDEAQRDELVGVREDEDGVTWIWMTSPSA